MIYHLLNNTGITKMNNNEYIINWLIMNIKDTRWISQTQNEYIINWMKIDNTRWIYHKMNLNGYHKHKTNISKIE